MLDDLVRTVLGVAAVVFATMSWRLVPLVKNPHRKLSLQWIAAVATIWGIFELIVTIDVFTRPWDAWLSRLAVTITIAAVYVVLRSIRKAEGLE